MKKSLLTALLLGVTGLANAADTAKLFASNLGNGITNVGGTAVATGTVRFGTFPVGFDFAANANNFTALDAAFVQVHSFSGNIRTQNANGFFDLSTTFATNGAFETVPYDSSASSTNNVAGDIAGERIFVWILNNTTAASATEQAIFSITQTWPDKDELFTDVFASIDTGAAGLTAHLGALAAGNDIGAGAPSHNMANPLGSAVVTRTAPAGVNPQVLRNTVVTFSVTVSGTGPFDYRWRKDGVEVGGAGTTLGSASATNTYSIGTAELDEDGDYDVVVTNSIGSIESNVVTLDVFTTAPVVTLDALSKILKIGDALQLVVAAEGQATLKYQWSLNGKAIAGATNPTFNLNAVTLKDGGNYTCTVSNGTTAKDTSTAEVIVVDNTEKTLVLAASPTASTTLKVSVGGTPLAYEWFKDDVSLNVTTPSLLIKPLVASPTAVVYKCVVTGVAGSKDAATTVLKVFDTAPDFAFTTPGVPNMPNGIVGGLYTYQILVDQAANKAPTTYDATGLPAGVTINKATGLISGRPTKAGTNIKVTLKVSNSKTPARTIQDTIDIAALPANIAGTYVGPVERIDVLGAALGGKLDNLVVATTGVISGKLILGAASFPLTGSVNTTGLDPLTATVNASLTVKRTGTLAPLTVTFDLGNDLLSNGDITDNTSHVFFKGWRNKWLATPAVSSAAKYVATYNIAIGMDEGDPDRLTDVPKGFGYASFPVKADGKLAFAGKFADGNGVTGATFVGPTGQVFLFQTLYTNKGSFLGDLTIDDKADADAKNNEINDGDASWSAPVNLAAANKLYRNGFNFDLMIAGGAYTAPASKILLDLAANDVVDLAFEDGNIAAAAQNPDTTVTLLANNKFTVAAVAAKTALTVTPASGLFSGSFEAVAKKKTSFLGLIVPVQGVQQGLGYFLLDQAGTPVTQQSGAVFLEEPLP